MAGESRILMQVITQTLVDNAALAALVEGRVFSGHLRSPEDGEHSYPFVVVNPVTGQSFTTYSFQRMSVEVWCYSRQGADHAAEIYDTVKDALHAQRSLLDGVTMVVVTQEAIRPRNGRHDGLSAWFTMARYTASASA